MSQLEDFQTQMIIFEGGWDSNKNWLRLNQTPGKAAVLQNFEPSLFGGYRRINGYEYLEDTDSGEVDTGAEGPILGITFLGNDVIACRKQAAPSTVYGIYRWVSGGSWSAYTTGLTLTATNVNKVRAKSFNFGGTETIIFVDGVNNATMFDGTNWINIDPSASGANFANAGGDQALSAPSVIETFYNHIFVSGDSSAPNVISHAAPGRTYEGYNWNYAAGGGQIIAEHEVVQIARFRDKLYVFGNNEISEIYTDGQNFLIRNITRDIGCIAPDSVQEVNGDLIFLSPDGFRPISATERLNDIEIGNIAKVIQQDVKALSDSFKESEVHSVIVRGKSQYRCFFSNDSLTTDTNARGILGAIRPAAEYITWEWAETKGIHVSCCASKYIENANGILEEYVLHGGHDGKVYRQEEGNTFNGNVIQATFKTPHLHFEDPMLIKNPHEIQLFVRPEGDSSLTMGIEYDWGNSNAINPANYTLETTGTVAIYGTAVYGTDAYGGSSSPLMITNVEGSGYSIQFSFVTSGLDTDAPYTIMGMAIKYKLQGFK